MGVCLGAKLLGRLLRLVGMIIIPLILGGCLVSIQPLVTEQGATFPWETGTRLERVGTEKPPLTLQKADGYYVMMEPDGKEIQRIRMRFVSDGVYLVMTYTTVDDYPYIYGIARIVGDEIEVFYINSSNLEDYLTHLSATNPGEVQTIISHLVSHRDVFFKVASLPFLETILPKMLREGFINNLSPAYRIIRDDDFSPYAHRDQPSATPATGLDATIRRATADLVGHLEHGDWAQKEDGFKEMSIEFYTRAIFSYSVKLDRSECYFHFWREERTEEMLNRAYDKGCDGTVDAVKRFGDNKWDFSGILNHEKRFYAYYLPRYAALVAAANDYKSFNPRSGRLALLPDLNTMAENQRILQRIVDAASGTSLMAVSRDGKERPRPDELLMNVWVNGGADEGGVQVSFTANRVGRTGLKNCYVSAEDPKGRESSLDKNCDGTPEAWSDASGSRRVSAVGNEKVSQSLLLDMARFADVANAMFPPGEFGPFDAVTN